MTNNERTLLDLIRNHKDPTEALQTAVRIILEHLTPRGSSEAPAPADPRESV